MAKRRAVTIAAPVDPAAYPRRVTQRDLDAVHARLESLEQECVASRVIIGVLRGQLHDVAAAVRTRNGDGLVLGIASDFARRLAAAVAAQPAPQRVSLRHRLDQALRFQQNRESECSDATTPPSVTTSSDEPDVTR